jgi:hypothetical protein
MVTVYLYVRYRRVNYKLCYVYICTLYSKITNYVSYKLCYIKIL